MNLTPARPLTRKPRGLLRYLRLLATPLSMRILDHVESVILPALRDTGPPADAGAGRMEVVAGPLTMSSREIAELTGKRHDHVLRDIRAYVGAIIQMERGVDVRAMDWAGKEGMQLFGETPIGGVTMRLEVNNQNGQSYPVYDLDQAASITVVSGYNVTMRKRIVDRWMELEAKVVQPSPADLLNDPAAMRGLLLGYSEKVLALETLRDEVASMRPQVRALDRIASSDGLPCITDAAKASSVPTSGHQHKSSVLHRQTPIGRPRCPEGPAIAMPHPCPPTMPAGSPPDRPAQERARHPECKQQVNH